MDRIEYLQEKVKIVPIGNVYPNDWNPKPDDSKDFEKVKLSIEKFSLRSPIIVRETELGYEIVDGEQRYKACKDLGYTNLLIYNEGLISKETAQRLTIAYQQQVPFSEVELAYLLKKMKEEYGQLDLPLFDEEIDNLLKLADFNFDQFNVEQNIEDTKEFYELAFKLNKENYEKARAALNLIKKDNNLQTDEQAFLNILEIHIDSTLI